MGIEDETNSLKEDGLKTKNSSFDVKEAPSNKIDNLVLSEEDKIYLLDQVKILADKLEKSLVLKEDESLNWDIMLVAPKTKEKLLENLKDREFEMYFGYVPFEKLTKDKQNELIEKELSINKINLQASAHVEIRRVKRGLEKSVAEFCNLIIRGDTYVSKFSRQQMSLEEIVPYLKEFLSEDK